jgi:hypothetical protein
MAGAGVHRAADLPDACGLAFEISPLLFSEPDPLLGEWLDRKILTEEGILRGLLTPARSGNDRSGLIKNSQDRLCALRALRESVFWL